MGMSPMKTIELEVICCLSSKSLETKNRLLKNCEQAKARVFVISTIIRYLGASTALVAMYVLSTKTEILGCTLLPRSPLPTIFPLVPTKMK